MEKIIQFFSKLKKKTKTNKKKKKNYSLLINGSRRIIFTLIILSI